MSRICVLSLALTAAIWTFGVAAQERVRSGAELYANHCASCHGELGEGDGPVANAMRVTMPNLRGLAMRRGGTFPADEVRAYVDGRSIPASHGDRYMPIWGSVFGWGADGPEATEARIEQRVDAIVEHVRELQYRD